jgi:hypothetical protein
MDAARTRLPTKPLRGCLAHKKPPPLLGPPEEPRHGPTVGSYGVVDPYERGTPVGAGHDPYANGRDRFRVKRKELTGLKEFDLKVKTGIRP